jgi:hypothetical protein
MCIDLTIRYPLFWSHGNRLNKKNKLLYHIMKFRPVGAELFHADGQTDRHDEANSRFSQLCERA